MLRWTVLAVLFAPAASIIEWKSLCPNADLGSFVDMSSWVQAGDAPRWEVQEGGRTIKQYVNSPDPGFYISDKTDYINFVLKGTITIVKQENPDGTDVGQDNDFVGILVGMQKPLPDNLHEYDAMAFAWGGVAPSGGKHEWHTLHKLNGTIPPDSGRGHSSGWEGACFWSRTDGGFNRRDTPVAGSSKLGEPDVGGRYTGLREGVGCYDIRWTGKTGGWRMEQTYSFQVLFTEDRVVYSIDGDVLIDVSQQDVVSSCEDPQRTPPNRQDGALSAADVAKYGPQATSANCKMANGKAWRKGRIAWYNLSQHGVVYGNVRLFDLLADTTPQPKANEDIFGVTRTQDGNAFLQITREFHDGLLANDWSPSLLKLEPQLASQFNQDPIKDGAVRHGTAVVCEHGSIIQVNSDGSFVYKPDSAVLIPQVDAEQINVENCHYRSQDTNGQWSELRNITFALQPRSVIGLTFDINWQPEDHTLEWYETIEKEDSFGDLVANGSCIRIVDWSMTDSAGGKFALKGQKVVANRPDELTVGFKQRQHYVITVLAISIFGLTQEKDIIIEIPARCELKDQCICTAFVCECKPGFAGENCDECIPERQDISVNPTCQLCLECPLVNGTGFPAPATDGSVVGTCLYPPGRCSTFCHRDFTCSSHGECSNNTLTPGACVCDEGWTGDACDQCDTNYYLVAGDCVFCEAEETCGGAGLCNATTAKCDCTDRRGGPRCQYCEDPWYFPPACDQSCTRDQNCSGNGECVNIHLHMEHKCVCDEPFAGPWTINGCNVTCSRNATCNSHGECILGAGGADYSCNCDRDRTPDGLGMWKGDFCDECEDNWYPAGKCNKYCTPGETCSGRGRCDDQGDCICEANSWATGFFQGIACDECQPNFYPPSQCNVPCTRSGNCSSNGDCTEVGYCDCDPGFSGVRCDVCFPGYYPPAVCDQFCDWEVTCSGHGDCLPNGGCRCHDKWHGADCSTFCSDEITCNGNGVCDPRGECICDETFVDDVGSRCLECIGNYYPYKVCDTYCNAAQNCSSNGVCETTSGDCLCDWGWTGPDCSEQMPTLSPPTPAPPTPLPPTPMPTPVPVPTEANGTDDGAAVLEQEQDCLIMEIAGSCLGWLLLLMLLLLCCLALLAWYLMTMKKKKKKRPAKKKPAPVPKDDIDRNSVPLLEEQSPAPVLSGVEGAALATSPAPPPAAEGFKLGPGSLEGQEGIPAAAPAPLMGVEGATLSTSPAPPPPGGFKLGPGSLEGQEGIPLANPDAATMATSNAPPAADPLKMGPGSLAGQEAIPAAPLAGVQGASLSTSPAPANNGPQGFGPASLDGPPANPKHGVHGAQMSLLGGPAQKMGPGSTAGQEQVPALLGAASPPMVASGAQPAHPGAAPGIANAGPLLGGVAQPALAMSPAQPTNAGPSGFAPGGLGGMGPAGQPQAKSPLLGTSPGLLAMSPGQGQNAGTAGAPGAAPGKKVEFGAQDSPLLGDILGPPPPRPGEAGMPGAGPQLFGTPGAALAMSGGSDPQRGKVAFGKQDDDLLGTLTGSAPARSTGRGGDFGPADLGGLDDMGGVGRKGDLGRLENLADDPAHLAGAAAGRVPGAVREALKQPMPATVSGPLGSAMRDYDKKQAALEKAVKDAAGAKGTAPEVGNKLNNVLRDDWGPADLAGMGLDPKAVREGGAAEVVRDVLLNPPAGAANGGMDPKKRKQLEQALKDIDKSRAGVRDAAEKAVAAPDIPMTAEKPIRDALKDHYVMRDAQQSDAEGRVKEAASRGKVVDAAEKAAASQDVDPASRKRLQDALRDVQGADQQLQNAVGKMKDAGARDYVTSLMKDNSAWSPGDLGDMDPLVAKGKAPVAVKQALQGVPMPDADRKALEDAVRNADRAAGRLVDAEKAVLAASPAASTAPALRDAVKPHSQGLYENLDPLQRAGALRGRLPAAAAAAVDVVDPVTKAALQAPLAAHDAARRNLGQQLLACAHDPAVPSGARQMMQQAAADNAWGPAADLMGMDPMLRAALGHGQVAAAAGVMMQHKDIPPQMHQKLEVALRGVEKAEQDLKAATQKILSDPTKAAGQRDALQDALAGSSGAACKTQNSLLQNSASALQHAAVNGPVLVAAEKTLKTHPHAALQGAVSQAKQNQATFKAALTQVLPQLPATAQRQIQDAMDGKVNFAYGAADMDGMDPLKTLLTKAVEGVLATGGLGGAQAAALQSALKGYSGQQDTFHDAVRTAIGAHGLPDKAKRELEEALCGKVHVRGRDNGFAAADIDLTSDEFAPLGFPQSKNRPPMGLALGPHGLLGAPQQPQGQGGLAGGNKHQGGASLLL